MLILRTQMVDAFIALIFGLGLVVAPALILSILGAHTDDAGIVVARILGATLLGYAGMYPSTFLLSPLAPPNFFHFDDPSFTVEQLTLEDLVLAYMSRAATDRRPALETTR